MAAPTKAVAKVEAASLDHAELMALLGESGMAPKASENQFRRMTLKSGSLITDEGQPDQESWPPTKRGPVMTVRIVKPPVYYNAFFLDSKEEYGAIDPSRIGRPDMNKKFVKKYDDPSEQAADQYSYLDVYEQVRDLVGKNGSFKGDIQLQIVPESGEMTGDEPIYTLSLSTTSAIDFRGSSKNPERGVVQEKNFIVQLGEFAIAHALENGTDPRLAVVEAMTQLKLGGVVAEIYLVLTSNEEKTRDWTVVAFKPVHVEFGQTSPALPEGDVTVNSDDIPF